MDSLLLQYTTPSALLEIIGQIRLLLKDILENLYKKITLADKHKDYQNHKHYLMVLYSRAERYDQHSHEIEINLRRLIQKV